MTSLALWTPDIFTNSVNAFGACEAPLVATIARDAYGLSPTTVSQSQGFEANSHNFRVGDVILKHVTGNGALLQAQLHICQYLQEQGMAMPTILPNAEGRLLTRVNDTWWIALEYIEGHFFAGSAHEMTLLVDMMPRLFHLLEAYPKHPSLTCLPQRPLLDATQALPTACAHFGADIQTLWHNCLEDIRAIRAQVVAALPRFAVDVDLVHIDIHPRNVLYSNGKLYLLDCDSFQRQSRAIAYNFAVYKMLRRCRTNQGPSHEARDALFAAGAIPRNPVAAQAEILYRLCAILAGSSPGNLSVWHALIPVHVRGVYEAAILLGETA